MQQLISRLFCLLLCGFVLLLLTRPAAAQTQKPNIVFILADDMGYGDIGSYGVKDIRTPHLDRLAREGVRLTDFYANGPVCTPTRAAFITGRWQQRVGLEWATVPALHADAGLPVSETSIARMLKGSGYATAMFGKWHLGYKPEFGPLAHGFDEFFGILSGNVDMNSHRYRTGQSDLWEGTQAVERKGYLTDLIADRAVDFIGRNTSKPFFLYVPFNAVHWPFQPPGNPEDVRNEQTWYDGTRADYAKMLEGMDTAIGRILAALDKGGLARNTLVIFTNDNGGERLSRNAPLFHHKATLWEGGIRVPCLLRWPEALPAGKTSSQAAITMDLTATILAATNTQPPAGRALDGMNLLPILQGRQPNTERTFFWRINRDDRKQKAVRKGKWKYLRDGTIEVLFDLEADIGERNDVSYSNQAVQAELRARLAEWEKEVDRVPPLFVVR
jgi:arylsulfatase A